MPSGFTLLSSSFHCSGESFPLRMSVPVKPVSATISRVINCVDDISSEKKATGVS